MMKAFKKMLQSTPKLRGFTSLAVKPAEVYLSDLETNFNAGDTVNLAVLKEKNLVNSSVRSVKIVQTGELTKKLMLAGIKATKGATEKIIAAGGEVA